MYRKDKPSDLEVRKFININRGIVYGAMLGDATIDGRGRVARLRIRHAESQKEYVLHKYSLFRQVASSDPTGSLWSNGHTVWGFDTSISSEWQRIWSRFHQDSPVEIRTLSNGKTIRYHRKVVTKHILKDLDDHGLAIWFMDDGCLDVHHNKARRHRSKRFVLSTDGFTLEENELIRAWFLERYGVNTQLAHNNYTLKNGTKKRSCRIRIGWLEYQKLIPRIEKFFIPSMRYKLEPPQDKGIPKPFGNMTRSDLAGDRESQPEMVDHLMNNQACTAENDSTGK